MEQALQTQADIEEVEDLKKIKPANIQVVAQYVTVLRQKIGLYIPWIPEDSHEVENFYEILENDAAVSHALNIISLMSSGEFFEIKATNKDMAKIIVKALSYIRRFGNARKSMVQKSLLYGLSIQRKYWKKVTWRKYPGLVWEVPTSLLEVDVRRLRIERDTRDKSNMWWTIWCPKLDQYIKLENRNINPYAPIAEQDFIWTEYEREEMSPYKKGIGEVLFALVYIKNKTIQYWSELNEKYGTPFLVGQIQSAASAFDSAMKMGSGSQNAADKIGKFLTMLENMRSRHVAVIPDKDSITIHEAGSQGANILQQLIDYVDNKIQLLILGAELTTMAPSVGSYALGQAHKGITGSIVTYNKNIVEEELERDLVQDFIFRNRRNLLSLGIDIPEEGEIKVILTDSKTEQQEEMMEKMPPSHRNMKNLGL